MDSLLANYASSDEDREGESEKVNPPSSDFSANSPSSTSNYGDTARSSSSIISSLPPPKSSSSSLFSSLPPPKSHLSNASQTPISLSSSRPKNQQQEDDEGEDDGLRQLQLRSESGGPVKPSNSSSSLPGPKSSSSSSTASIFSSLPPPKTLNTDPFSLGNLPSAPSQKKVVQLKLPLDPSLMKSSKIDDDEDDAEEDNERDRKNASESSTETTSVKSFLSSIPAPKNSSTLGALPSAAGTGRRSILEDAPSFNASDFNSESQVAINSNMGNYDGQWVDGSSSAPLEGVTGPTEYAVGTGGGTSGWVSSTANYENYGGYASYGNYGYYGQYDGNWGDASTAVVPSETVGTAESMVKMSGKRGRNDVPPEIVEVKQDELVKNRPREDQVKLTGIAFGPAYQPASSKGKPSKLHKRKHQIGSLYYDMKQKEMELAERRARGFLTKAETQGKYGW
ncbi:hypothetical protein NMG60_11034414 [Bertholletia excelsa]